MEKFVDGYPLYKIDSAGNVYSCIKRVSSKTEITHAASNEWKCIKPVLDKHNGYFLVSLVDLQGKKRNKHIHRLLATHFIPNPTNKPHVNHIDGNKQNNSLTNLEWATCKENAMHAMSLGLYEPAIAATRKGIDQYSLSGDFLASHISIHEAGRITGVAWQNISKVLRGERKHAGNFFWKYK